MLTKVSLFMSAAMLALSPQAKSYEGYDQDDYNFINSLLPIEQSTHEFLEFFNNEAEQNESLYHIGHAFNIERYTVNFLAAYPTEKDEAIIFHFIDGSVRKIINSDHYNQSFYFFDLVEDLTELRSIYLNKINQAG